MGEVTSTGDWAATGDGPELERRSFVEQVRHENENDFGPPARQMVETMLAAGHPHPWAYVYELSQNAIDAGARRISWRTNGRSLFFQHDGDGALDEDTVRGLSSIGASTKGQDAIGFMGVGFKSVFNRFRTARVSGFGWRIKFDIGMHRGALDTTFHDWFDALRPHWDPERLDPDAGYTTAFSLTRSVAPTAGLADDLARLASPDDPTPLSVLALRGLEQVRIDDVTWDLSVRDGVVEVRRTPDGLSRRWRFFESWYRPDDAAMRRFLEARPVGRRQVARPALRDDAAMRRFLEARRDLTYQETTGAERPERSVVALVPLDQDGLPNPPSQGRVYATLPTRVLIPFGFHLQADWLVNLERQNLRAIKGDPWQEAILRQVPVLVREILLWLREESESARSRGYRILCDPTRREGEMSDVLGALRCDFIRLLSDLEIVPVLGPETRRFCTPQEIVRLPGRFLGEFGKRPAWRPDLLFDRDLMDEGLLGSRAVQFASWLGWGHDIDPDRVAWAVTLPRWWSAVDENTAPLFSLWSCVSEREWHHAPVVPTEADGWLPAHDTCWLNEKPPSDKEPSGAVVAKALVRLLPAPEQRLPPRIRELVNQDRAHPGVAWLQERHQVKLLRDIVRRGCADADGGNPFPLVELLDWAVARGPNRQNLVPLVLTEDGAHKPSVALLADPLVPGGEDRRRLFPNVPALVEDYALIDDQQAAVRFIEGLEVRGDATLKERRFPVGYDKQAVGKRLGIEVDQIKPAARASGCTVLDYDLPLNVQTVPLDALQSWLSREHTLIAHKGTLKATSSYHGPKTTDGVRRSRWVKELEQLPWILCDDGERRKPADLLLQADSDYEDAPLAEIDRDLANRLEQEGIRFGTNISRSPVLFRLEKQGSSNLPDTNLAGLLEEALAEIEAGTVTRDELISALRSVKLRGVPLDRVVREAGRPGTRSALGKWVVALSSVEAPLAAAVDRIEIELPGTTTGQQALGYLTDLWRRRPESVDEIRAHIASAYRYVLQDLERDDLDRGVWRDAKKKARLYGKGGWHEISDALVVDDVRSPFIRQLLTARRIAVSAAHLGGAPEQIRLVATELGIACLSTKIKVSKGPELPRPPWMGNLERLVAALGTLEGRQPLGRITCREHLALRVEGESHEVTAYLVHDELMVSGTPETFGTEAAEQLVEHFQLGQRGNSIPRLTAALGSLGEDARFSENLKVLASGLGLTVPEPTTVRPEADAGETPPTNQVDPTGDADTTRTVPDSLPEPPDGQSRRVTRRDQNTRSTKPTPDSSRAANQFGILVGRNRGEASSVSGAGTSDEVESAKTKTPPKDDRKARAAVVKYETRQGRRAEEMPPGQPGFDVLSYDPVGPQRRIEVKGVKGVFEEDASVLLTARQVEDALQHEDHDVEYWLYVVDRTETDDPQVYPIPWTRNRRQLRYGFYADMWAQCAERDGDTPKG